jgi:ABC-type nitrate/sulfonate/bicarbonate transport system permease component
LRGSKGVGAEVTRRERVPGTTEGSTVDAGAGVVYAPPHDPWIKTLLDKTWFLRLVVYGALILAFQIVAVRQGPFFLPTVPDVLKGIVELFTAGHILVLGPTLQQLTVGFLLAIAIAVPMGALMGRFGFAEDLLAPWVNTIYVTSKESLLPIIILIFGLGFGYRVMVVILFAIFFPVINTAAGVRYVERELRETARAFATPRWRMFTRVYLPAAAPFIVAGIRMGLAMAIKGMVIAEIWVYIGTGELLTAFTLSPRRLHLYYALAVVIIAVAIILNELLKVAEQRLRPYARVQLREAL